MRSGALVAKTVVAEQIGIVAEVAAIRAPADAFVVDHAVPLPAIRLRQRPVRRRKEIEIGRRGNAAVDDVRRPALDDSTAGWRLKRGEARAHPVDQRRHQEFAITGGQDVDVDRPLPNGRPAGSPGVRRRRSGCEASSAFAAAGSVRSGRGETWSTQTRSRPHRGVVP